MARVRRRAHHRRGRQPARRAHRRGSRRASRPTSSSSPPRSSPAISRSRRRDRHRPPSGPRRGGGRRACPAPRPSLARGGATAWTRCSPRVWPASWRRPRPRAASTSTGPWRLRLKSQLDAGGRPFGAPGRASSSGWRRSWTISVRWCSRAPVLAHGAYVDPLLRPFTDLDLLVDGPALRRQRRRPHRPRVPAHPTGAGARVRQSGREGADPDAPRRPGDRPPPNPRRRSAGGRGRRRGDRGRAHPRAGRGPGRAGPVMGGPPRRVARCTPSWVTAWRGACRSGTSPRSPSSPRWTPRRSWRWPDGGRCPSRWRPPSAVPSWTSAPRCQSRSPRCRGSPTAAGPRPRRRCGPARSRLDELAHGDLRRRVILTRALLAPSPAFLRWTYGTLPLPQLYARRWRTLYQRAIAASPRRGRARGGRGAARRAEPARRHGRSRWRNRRFASNLAHPPAPDPPRRGSAAAIRTTPCRRGSAATVAAGRSAGGRPVGPRPARPAATHPSATGTAVGRRSPAEEGRSGPPPPDRRDGSPAPGDAPGPAPRRGNRRRRPRPPGSRGR